jgi:hypothetical protein
LTLKKAEIEINGISKERYKQRKQSNIMLYNSDGILSRTAFASMKFNILFDIYMFGLSNEYIFVCVLREIKSFGFYVTLHFNTHTDPIIMNYFSTIEYNITVSFHCIFFI